VIALICTLEPYRIDWLPQLVAHYRELGVERFLLSLQIEPNASQSTRDSDFARFREVLASLGVAEAWLWQSEFSGPALIKHQRTLQSECLCADYWIVWCDSDEFQVYPSALPDLIAGFETRGIDFVRGIFVDRIAADYGLPPFDPTTPLWDAFPRTCNVTAALAGGERRKVVLARAGVMIGGGKHFPIDMKTVKTIKGWVQIHHFKWDATLIERLRYRVTPEWQARFPWWVESQRLIDYLIAHDLHFDPADIEPICLDGPGYIALGDWA
jgi:hypothetical protein